MAKGGTHRIGSTSSFNSVSPTENKILSFIAKTERQELKTLFDRLSNKKPPQTKMSTAVTIFIMMYTDCLSKKNTTGALSLSYQIVETATAETQNLIERLFLDDNIHSADLMDHLKDSVIVDQSDYISVLQRLIAEKLSISH